ncbi:DNA-binding transcriptional regulator YhcF, GntR family [Amycolatopsis arida]|uniref:DNA-binding transcriptional regulator YhcF, GntR family n=1 Tax=Amycolatopsis arida TaxID=587909 RepID=A0A1I5Q0N2_9PSEU|nr:TetR/AcrR family transcriptional regulator C-terminal domain-containing protein [Amycolatopsis arida]TDX98674.1 DNA-binding transcriptional regulator YhcF (GntR family) [Amycolatopsis arida]SFP39759.1 DNA-binding transcriptional regulator YhcF, GntR family [Amycolatopsis arida]
MTLPDPPYARITAEIRARIAAGELAPGDRVPSARRISRDHGVAIATATKVLAALRREGLVRAVPGIGTVVVERPVSSTRPSTPELSRDRVVRTAIGIADAEGLAGLSMRRIATELGVVPMALYRHVPSKDALVAAMIDVAFGVESLPEVAPPGWRERLESMARLEWRTFRRHRWLAQAISLTRPHPSRNALLHTEWALAALDGRGMHVHQMFALHLTLFGYVRGIAVNLEWEAEAEADTGRTGDQWMDDQLPAYQELIGSGDFPHMRRLFAAGDFDLDLDQLFELGLQRLLDGVALALPPETGDAPAAEQ